MRFRALVVLLILGAPARHSAGQEASTPDGIRQLEEAVLAAPASMRAQATVLGHGGDARPGDPLTLLREGTNGLICMADDPAEPGFHVACYQRNLDAFMVLGRRLRAEGRGRDEIMDARYAALESGELVMPRRGVLYSLTADELPESVEGARRLVVVYVPGATPEELGLPARPDGDSPWLMLPGTPWAHIMIGR